MGLGKIDQGLLNTSSIQRKSILVALGALTLLTSEVAAQVITLTSRKTNTAQTIGQVPQTIHGLSTSLDGILPAGACYIPAEETNNAYSHRLKEVFAADPILLHWIGEIITLEKTHSDKHQTNFALISWGQSGGPQNPFTDERAKKDGAYNSANIEQYLPVDKKPYLSPGEKPGIVFNARKRESSFNDGNILRNELIERLIAARCKQASPEWSERKLSAPLVQLSTYIIDLIFAREMNIGETSYDAKINNLRSKFSRNSKDFLDRVGQDFKEKGAIHSGNLCSYAEISLANKAPNSLLTDVEKVTIKKTLAEHIVSYIGVDPNSITFEEKPFSVEIDGKEVASSYFVPIFAK